MTKTEDSILTDIQPENITVVENLDLNGLFNLTYNFDLLKGIITTILKNQDILKKQIETERRKNNEQNRTIESIKSNILLIKEKYMTKEGFNPTKNQIDNINAKIIQTNDKISKIEEEIAKSKKNIFLNLIFII